MHDLYQVPAFILTILLLPAFGQLYLRTRDIRNLLWFLAFLLVAVRSSLLFSTGSWAFLSDSMPWSSAVGQACALVAAALFLSSLSPLSFRFGRYRVLYVVPFTAPLIVYALLAHALYHNRRPAGVMFWVFPALGFFSILVVLLWSRAKGSLPTWLGLTVCVFFGGFAVSFYFRTGLYWPLILAESGIYLLASLLVISVFRRLSTGVAVSFLGFVLWSLPVLFIFKHFGQPEIQLLILRLVVMAKAATALGLILLALENELAVNKSAREREERARHELEAYASLQLSRRRIEDFDRQAGQICHAVAEHSRFPEVGLLLLHGTGMYRLAGSSGLNGATAAALDSLAARIPVSEFLKPSSAPAVVENSQAVRLDLRSWMRPGDDLERLNFTSVIAVPLRGHGAPEGALLLAGMRTGQRSDALRLDDLAPIEMLTARMQSLRSQTRMLEKLIDSEKFAGLGQLAGNVMQQLNNPLTVILGYGSLLEEAGELEGKERKGLDAILNAARSMRSTLESLRRIARTPSGQLSAISVPELLADMEHLQRSEFLQRSIDFQVTVADELPRVLCEPQQLRQAILHCLQFALEAMESAGADSDRSVRVEAKAAGPHVRITIAHSGPGFEHPEHAFDPFVPTQAAADETLGLRLSLCATILRENNGRAMAMNLKPTGAAIVLELEAA
jgi:signal transduction histidine kinase